MGHKQDYWEKLRRIVIPKIGLISQWLEDLTGDDYYVKGETHNNQFVGRVPMTEEEFEVELHEMGFERNPLASLKSLESGETEEGSWRKVGFGDHPDMQLHVILYDGDMDADVGDSGYVYVYAHWEMRWDTHPIKHYRGIRLDDDTGVKKMKNILNENGVQHEAIRP